MSATKKMWARRLARAKAAVQSGKLSAFASNLNPILWLTLLAQMLCDLVLLPFRLLTQLLTRLPVFGFFIVMTLIMLTTLVLSGIVDSAITTGSTSASPGNLGEADTPQQTLELIQETRASLLFPQCLDERVERFYKNYPIDRMIESKHVLQWKRSCEADEQEYHRIARRKQQEEQIRAMMKR